MGEELEKAKRFAAELAALFGEQVRSVVLYGSAAREQFHEGTSDLNVLALFRHLDGATIRRGAELARGWVEAGNPPPLLLSEDELHRSLDIFAIEYSDIRDAHRVLHGDDPFEGLEVRPEHLRLQCERELKGALIQFRERYLLVAGSPEELDRLLRRSLSTFLVLFRTVLRLVGDAVPEDAGAVVDATAARIGFDAGIFHQILRARRGGADLALEADDPRVDDYLAAIMEAVAFVDALPVGAAGER